jgi:preprotein translocase SecE subunit
MAKKPNTTPKKPTKVNSRELAQESKVMSILKKEYAFENWLLAILSPILILYGVYIVMGKFGSVDLASILGSSGVGFIDFFFSTALRRILTGSFLILIGGLVLVYLLIPYIKPSIIELKKVTWPTTKTLASNTGKVFAFLLFLSVVFVIYGAVLNPLFRWLYQL